MQQNLNDVTFLYPHSPDFDQILAQHPLEPFAGVTLDFLDALSKKLFSHPRARQLPDVVTFAFWCRKGNLLKLRQQHLSQRSRLGRGVVFHIAPSNVPINFAYSLAAGMLAGNINIVRASSKDFEQTRLVAGAVASLFEQGGFAELAPKVVLVQYDRGSSATGYFSSLCDVRVIWGGDSTVAEIRKSPIPPRSYDVTFADRYSFCAIHADAYIQEPKPEEIAQKFYNDTFLYDQNACSAPHLMIWTGSEENVEKAKEIFWGNLNAVVHQKYELAPVVAVDKLTAFYRQALGYGGIKKEKGEDNFIVRLSLDQLRDTIPGYRCYGGYFCEYTAGDLAEAGPIVNRKYQTLAYYGYPLEQLRQWKEGLRLCGVDRIVPIGQTASFSLFWDGYDLIATLSSICDIY